MSIKALYICDKCVSVKAVNLYWSEAEQDWLCDECWDDRDSENEPKGICLADEIKNQKEGE
jgi:hypothetical protein